MDAVMLRHYGLALATLITFVAWSVSYAQSLDPQKPAALGAGINKGNVDSMSGDHYYYFWAGPGHIDVKMAFKEMGIFGAPLRQALNFDFFDESRQLLSHNAVVSIGNLERIVNSGDFRSRQKVVLAVTPQKALVRLGGYYEIEVTGAAAFDGPASATAGVAPKGTQLVHPGGPLIQPGGALVQPGAALYKPGQASAASPQPPAGHDKASRHTKTAQGQINIPQVAATTCAVMSGQRKLDGRALQYLLLLDDDLVGNPVTIVLYREVINQCPKAYLNYQQRKRVSNPFPPGFLVNPNPSPLITPGSSLTNQSPASQTRSRGDMAKYDEAIQLRPNDAKVYGDRGNSRFAQQDYQGAIADYTEMIRLKPKYPEGYANRGLARKNSGDKQGAIADLRVAMTLFKAQGEQNAYRKVLGWLKEAQDLP